MPGSRVPVMGGAVLGLLVAGWAPAADRREAVVLLPVENMYSHPDPATDVVSQAVIGQVVAVSATEADFARIETPDHYPGWIRQAALLSYPGPAVPRYGTRGTLGEVVSLVANIYREPSVTSARPMSQAPLGARLEVAPTPEKDGWHRLRLPNGEGGFIQAGDIRLREAGAPTPRGSPAELVATARRLLGLPYLWGGMTPWGLDCSGLVSLVYHAHGVTLPRDADLQFEDPRAQVVPRKHLRPGDLLFFGKAKVTHVGLYVGGGRFINATTHTTPTVREDALDDPHWSALYRGARRPR
ncbi:MAG TPA: C40 family peptidase [Vicinamibacteria bacterium]|nr:C40 family peptidase [Vicinamibacteria bacterium]